MTDRAIQTLVLPSQGKLSGFMVKGQFRPTGGQMAAFTPAPRLLKRGELVSVNGSMTGVAGQRFPAVYRYILLLMTKKAGLSEMSAI